MRIRAVYEPMHQRIGLYIIDKNGDQVSVAQPIVMETKQGRHVQSFPCLEVDDKSAFQELFDDLWALGMRPSARSDEYKAQLATMREHLNDMRALVFKSDKRPDLK